MASGKCMRYAFVTLHSFGVGDDDGVCMLMREEMGWDGDGKMWDVEMWWARWVRFDEVMG